VGEPLAVQDWPLAHRFFANVTQITHDHTPKASRNRDNRRDISMS
jgi:hypothetical protein